MSGAVYFILSRLSVGSLSGRPPPCLNKSPLSFPRIAFTRTDQVVLRSSKLPPVGKCRRPLACSACLYLSLSRPCGPLLGPVVWLGACWSPSQKLTPTRPEACVLV